MNCIYATRKEQNGCSILNVNRCKPDQCMWYHTAETYLQSLHTARMNYIWKYGKDDYIKYVPDAWKKAYANHEMIEYPEKLIENTIANRVAKV